MAKNYWIFLTDNFFATETLSLSFLHCRQEVFNISILNKIAPSKLLNDSKISIKLLVPSCS